MSGKDKVIRFRDEFYPGVKLTFVDAESPQELYNILSGNVPPTEPPPVDYEYFINVPNIYSQRDSRWSNDKLGQPCSIKTIGNWGCLLVCYIMWERTKQISTRDPKTGNIHYTNSGCFNCQNILGGALKTANPNTIDYIGWLWEYDSRFYTRLDEHLRLGFPVPIEVDLHPDTGQWDQHWVLVNGKTMSGDYVACDPWTGDQINVRQKYQNKIKQGVFYQTKQPQQNDVRIGLHMSADGGDGVGFPQPLMQEISELRPKVIKYLSNHSVNMIQNTCSPQLNPLIILRAFLSWGGRAITSQQFYDWTISDVTRSVHTLTNMGIPSNKIVIEIHNEPNLYSEGFGYSWNSGSQWGEFSERVLNLYRQSLQGFLFCPGGLSPGGNVQGIRADSRAFLGEFGSHINSYDYNAVHLYTESNWENDIWWLIENETKQKKILITECSYLQSVDGDSYALKLNQLIEILKTKPLVEGVTFFCSSGSNPDFYDEYWIRSNDPYIPHHNIQSRGVAKKLRQLQPV